MPLIHFLMQEATFTHENPEPRHVLHLTFSEHPKAPASMRPIAFLKDVCFVV